VASLIKSLLGTRVGVCERPREIRPRVTAIAHALRAVLRAVAESSLRWQPMPPMGRLEKERPDELGPANSREYRRRGTWC
jgi:hypothetical protein